MHVAQSSAISPASLLLATTSRPHGVGYRGQIYGCLSLLPLNSTVKKSLRNNHCIQHKRSTISDSNQKMDGNPSQTGFKSLSYDVFASGILVKLSRGDQCRLSATSKQIRNAVEPTLCRSISWRWQHDVPKHPPVHLLVRTFLSRPDLALHITEIELHGRKPRVAWKRCPFMRDHLLLDGLSISVLPHDEAKDLSAAEMAMLKEMIVSLRFQSQNYWYQGPDEEPQDEDTPDEEPQDEEPQDEDTQDEDTEDEDTQNVKPQNVWLKELERGEIDILVGILLYESLNLRRLVLESDFQCNGRFTGDVIRHGLRSTAEQQFSSLRSVTFSDDVTQDMEVFFHIMDLNQVFPLFYSQSIVELSASLPSVRIVWPLVEIPKSSLTSLTLTHSQLAEEDLGSLLMATPRLKTLKYQSHYDLATGGRPW